VIYLGCRLLVVDKWENIGFTKWIYPIGQHSETWLNEIQTRPHVTVSSSASRQTCEAYFRPSSKKRGCSIEAVLNATLGSKNGEFIDLRNGVILAPNSSSTSD
jgi:hypothetical protein